MYPPPESNLAASGGVVHATEVSGYWPSLFRA